ncbi:MAG: META domain-containing protein [Flavobacteriales bacterium Tduv]
MKHISVYIRFLGLLLLIGCGTTKNQYPSSIAYGGEWVLQDTGEVQVDDRKIYISLDPSTSFFRGFGGCNKIQGNYLITGNSIDLFKITTTKKSCKEIKTENTFISLLRKADKVKITPSNFELYKGSIILLIFKRER